MHLYIILFFIFSVGMGAVNSISATQSGQYLASAGHDGHVYFWNVASGMDYSIDGRNTG